MSQNSERNLESNSSSSPSSNNYYRHSTNSGTKATRLNEHSQGNGSSSRLNQLSVAAAMISHGFTDPAAYGAFLNSQTTTAAMINKQKQQNLPSQSINQQTTSVPQRTSYAHESGLPIPKKVALGTDRYKQQRHTDWSLSSFRQQSQSYNAIQHHSSTNSNKMIVNQSRSTYLPPAPPPLNTHMNSDINNLPSSLQRKSSSPPTYTSTAAATAAHNKLLPQTKLWYAAVQAATQAYHLQQQQQTSNSAINELQNYIHRPNITNDNHNKMSSHWNAETLKNLSTNNNNNNNKSFDDQHHYANDPRYRLIRGSYSNTPNSCIPSTCFIKQKSNQNNSPPIFNPQQQQVDMFAAAYQNYRRRSSGFSSTTSRLGPSDDESDDYIPPRKDSV